MRVAIIANPRLSTGADAREASLQAVLDEIGAEHRVVRPRVGVHGRGLVSLASWLATGRSVPEAIAWNPGPVQAELEAFAPDVVILETARAVHPQIVNGPWTVVLDYVDQLSESYEQRARISGGLGALAYRCLAISHRRVEGKDVDQIDHTIAAGAHCATELDATWIPNVVKLGQRSSARAGSAEEFDLVFFGNLSYGPNVEAVDVLDELAHELGDLRVLIAGRHATNGVREVCARNEWHLLDDFESVAQLGGLASVAVAPLRSAVGIQNKVLEAAAEGIPQLISPAAAKGLGEGSPIPTAELGEAFVKSLHELCSDATVATRAGDEALRFVETYFTAAVVGEQIATMLGWSDGRSGLRTAA